MGYVGEVPVVAVPKGNPQSFDQSVSESGRDNVFLGKADELNANDTVNSKYVVRPVYIVYSVLFWDHVIYPRGTPSEESPPQQKSTFCS